MNVFPSKYMINLDIPFILGYIQSEKKTPVGKY